MLPRHDSGALVEEHPAVAPPKLSASRFGEEEEVALWRLDHDEDRQANAKRRCEPRSPGPFSGDKVLGNLLCMPWHRKLSCGCQSGFGCEISPSADGSSLYVARCLEHRRGRKRNKTLGLQEMFERGKEREDPFEKKALANGWGHAQSPGHPNRACSIACRISGSHSSWIRFVYARPTLVESSRIRPML